MTKVTRRFSGAAGCAGSIGSRSPRPSATSRSSAIPCADEIALDALGALLRQLQVAVCAAARIGVAFHREAVFDEPVVAQRRSDDVELAPGRARQLGGVGVERDQQRGARTWRHRRPTGGTDAQAARAHRRRVQRFEHRFRRQRLVPRSRLARRAVACACRAGTMARPSHHTPSARHPPSPCFIATSPRSSPTATPCADHKDLDSPTMVPSEPEARYPHTSVDHSRNERYPNAAGRHRLAAFLSRRPKALRDGAALPKGSRLQEFEIEELVGEGGFSIVYRARDTLLGRTVALKEYLPASLARRGAGQAVAPRSARHRSDLRARPAQLHQRGAAAGVVRPPVAGQGVPLLGGERHRLHGDAALRRADAGRLAARAQCAGRRSVAARAARAAARRARADAWQPLLPPRHRARQRPAARPGQGRAPAARSLTTMRRTRCCSTSAPRGA